MSRSLFSAASRRRALRRSSVPRAGLRRAPLLSSSTVPPELEAFVEELRGALARSHIGFDAKDFVSHVTLLRDAHEPKGMPALDPISWKVDGFSLVRSVTLPRGSHYEIRKSWMG